MVSLVIDTDIKHLPKECFSEKGCLIGYQMFSYSYDGMLLMLRIEVEKHLDGSIDFVETDNIVAISENDLKELIFDATHNKTWKHMDVPAFDLYMDDFHSLFSFKHEDPECAFFLEPQENPFSNTYEKCSTSAINSYIIDWILANPEYSTNPAFE